MYIDESLLSRRCHDAANTLYSAAAALNKVLPLMAPDPILAGLDPIDATFLEHHKPKVRLAIVRQRDQSIDIGSMLLGILSSVPFGISVNKHSQRYFDMGIVSSVRGSLCLQPDCRLDQLEKRLSGIDDHDVTELFTTAASWLCAARTHESPMIVTTPFRYLAGRMSRDQPETFLDMLVADNWERLLMVTLATEYELDQNPPVKRWVEETQKTAPASEYVIVVDADGKPTDQSWIHLQYLVRDICCLHAQLSAWLWERECDGLVKKTDDSICQWQMDLAERLKARTRPNFVRDKSSTMGALWRYIEKAVGPKIGVLVGPIRYSIEDWERRTMKKLDVMLESRPKEEKMDLETEPLEVKTSNKRRRCEPEHKAPEERPEKKHVCCCHRDKRNLRIHDHPRPPTGSMAKFISQCCDTGSKLSSPAEPLFKAFKKFTRQPFAERNRFFTDLHDSFCKSRGKKNTTMYLGLALRDDTKPESRPKPAPIPNSVHLLD